MTQELTNERVWEIYRPLKDWKVVREEYLTLNGVEVTEPTQLEGVRWNQQMSKWHREKARTFKNLNTKEVFIRQIFQAPDLTEEAEKEEEVDEEEEEEPPSQTLRRRSNRASSLRSSEVVTRNKTGRVEKVEEEAADNDNNEDAVSNNATSQHKDQTEVESASKKSQKDAKSSTATDAIEAPQKKPRRSVKQTASADGTSKPAVGSPMQEQSSSEKNKKRRSRKSTGGDKKLQELNAKSNESIQSPDSQDREEERKDEENKSLRKSIQSRKNSQKADAPATEVMEGEAEASNQNSTRKRPSKVGANAADKRKSIEKRSGKDANSNNKSLSVASHIKSEPHFCVYQSTISQLESKIGYLLAVIEQYEGEIARLDNEIADNAKPTKKNKPLKRSNTVSNILDAKKPKTTKKRVSETPFSDDAPSDFADG